MLSLPQDENLERFKAGDLTAFNADTDFTWTIIDFGMSWELKETPSWVKSNKRWWGCLFYCGTDIQKGNVQEKTELYNLGAIMIDLVRRPKEIICRLASYENLFEHINTIFSSDHPFDKLMLELLPWIMKEDPYDRISFKDINQILGNPSQDTASSEPDSYDFDIWSCKYPERLKLNRKTLTRTGTDD